MSDIDKQRDLSGGEWYEPAVEQGEAAAWRAAYVAAQALVLRLDGQLGLHDYATIKLIDNARAALMKISAHYADAWGEIHERAE